MRWTQELRVKLARMVKEKALAIQEDEFNHSRKDLRTFGELVNEVDRRIIEAFEPLGFMRANKDWEHEVFYGDPPMFKPSRTTLWFDTVQGRIVKIRKKDAEKVLLLGFP